MSRFYLIFIPIPTPQLENIKKQQKKKSSKTMSPDLQLFYPSQTKSKNGRLQEKRPYVANSPTLTPPKTLYGTQNFVEVFDRIGYIDSEKDIAKKEREKNE